jgi:CheY-like chemotaxis protein
LRLLEVVLELGVADTGPGIAPDVLERMFEPFFTTKEVGKGSGMGLATVHGIVHEYGGHITVDTAPGHGSTFRLLFPPLSDTHSAASEAPTERDAPLPGRLTLRGRVLVVDDEEMVAELMHEMLAGWGLQTTVMRNPVEAEAWFMQDPQRVDLVLSDFTMPKITGLELAQRLTLVRPDLPVLLYSGFGTDIDPADAARSGVSALIAKPVEPRVLFEILREHLPEPGSPAGE